MSRVVIIGGSGHVGSYLVPRLVEAGYDVCNVTRGERQPYLAHGAWKHVQNVVIDREAEEKAGTFGRALRNLKADVLIDMICFTPESAKQMVESLNGHVGHVLSCGTIWVHGPSVTVPTTEAQPRRPFGEYGIRKAAIEALLLDEARRNRFPATVLHPGHIVGEGWNPLNPAGHFNPKVFATLARGEELALPNLGMETVHHVHADDVAQAFMKAIANWRVSVGEVLPRRLAGGGDAEGLCRGGRRLVRRRPEPDLSALGRVEDAAKRGGSGGDLGPYRAQPKLLDRQGAPAARLRAALHFLRGGA